MRVALHNPFPEPWVAEAELSRRLAIACENLGWQVAEVHTAQEIRAFAPDFVLALHSNAPKLAGYPTYGCMWNPPSMFEGTDPFVTNILTYDGYLVSSPVIARWLHHLLCHTSKQYLTAPIYTSCPQTDYRPPNLDNLRLFYCGSNWDGLRYRELFEQLDQQPYLEVYGKPEGWTHLKHSYRGALPYDGTSVLNALHRAGVGLCLHREDHTQAAVPSMRIFEIVAAGAIAICGEHTFIREAFGDTVLYIDFDAPPDKQVAQISRHMRWIATNQDIAKSMSQRAHRIFLERFTLERLLQKLVLPHETLIQQKGWVYASPAQSDQPTVEYIVRVEQQPLSELERSLNSLAQQSYPNVSAVLISDGSRWEIEGLPDLYANRMAVRILHCDPWHYRSTALWLGLEALKADYFGLLDEGVLYPNHVYSLMRLGNFPDRQDSAPFVLYSGGFVAGKLAHFRSFALEPLLRFENYIAPNAFLAPTRLLSSVQGKAPLLNSADDLCLLLHLCQQAAFRFSYEATAEAPFRSAALEDLAALRFIFWHQEFAPGVTIQSVQRQPIAQTEKHLSEALAYIEAMQSSKFWQMRSLWFKIKRQLKLTRDIR